MLVLSVNTGLNLNLRVVRSYYTKYRPDLMEFRLNNTDRNFLDKIFRFRTFPLIISCSNDLSITHSDELFGLYSYSINSGAEFIDVDLSCGKNFIKNLSKLKKRTKLIVSKHFYDVTPNFTELKNIFNRIYKLKPDLIKIVTHANSFNDNLRLFKLIDYAKKRRTEIIAHCMGEYGKSGRIISAILGSKFFYSSVNTFQTASGQIDIKISKEILRADNLNSKTKIFGIIGNPLTYSKSWLFHNYCYQKNNLNAVFLNFQISEPSVFLKNFGSVISGLSVTMPFKEEIIHKNYYQSKEVKTLKAANTLLKIKNNYKLFNTDFLGFEEIIKNNNSFNKTKILVIGAGGAARAVIAALIKYGNEVFVINRTSHRLSSIIQDFNVKSYNHEQVELIINCTPNDNDFALNQIKSIIKNNKIKVVVDLALHSFNTKIITYAKSKKIQTINGLDFFLEQAKKQFYLMTGKVTEIQTVKEFLKENYNLKF